MRDNSGFNSGSPRKVWFDRLIARLLILSIAIDDIEGRSDASRSIETHLFIRAFEFRSNSFLSSARGIPLPFRNCVRSSERQIERCLHRAIAINANVNINNVPRAVACFDIRYIDRFRRRALARSARTEGGMKRSREFARPERKRRSHAGSDARSIDRPL